MLGANTLTRIIHEGSSLAIQISLDLGATSWRSRFSSLIVCHAGGCESVTVNSKWKWDGENVRALWRSLFLWATLCLLVF